MTAIKDDSMKLSVRVTMVRYSVNLSASVVIVTSWLFSFWACSSAAVLGESPGVADAWPEFLTPFWRSHQGCVQYRNSLQTFRNSRVLEIGNFAKCLQTFRYWTQPRTLSTLLTLNWQLFPFQWHYFALCYPCAREKVKDFGLGSAVISSSAEAGFTCTLITFSVLTPAIWHLVSTSYPWFQNGCYPMLSKYSPMAQCIFKMLSKWPRARD